MAIRRGINCDCGNGDCNCIIKADPSGNLKVSGTGSLADPYILGETVNNTPTLACNLFGTFTLLPVYTHTFL